MLRLLAMTISLATISLAACTATNNPRAAQTATEVANSASVRTVPEESIDITATTVSAPEQKGLSIAATASITLPVLIATALPIAPEATETPTWLTTATTDGNFYVLGNPNAPIRLIDYSDFL